MKEVCKMCSNFDSLEESCLRRASFDFTANNCSDFIRYMNLIPQTRGVGRTILTVATKRGIERAIPAYPELELKLKCDSKGEVESIFTYQGQREIIRKYGLRLATKMAHEKGIQLVVLQHEQNDFLDADKNSSSDVKQSSRSSKNLFWMSESPIEVWT
ncbi:hypothetical protein IAQ67_14345 [Paenibacillus peoriae]|uniref:Uncharacterized protein n=2 Tax=Paenibacillus peoriae TaxID=59893 RepID=A0A7H0YGF7_9BACL|nr:hypothetical protein IAQ67_14345 [Paenibacillus peoriae]